MPKIKTHRGAAKRFKRTASGLLKGSHSFHSHILGKKSAKRKRGLRKATIVSAADMKRLDKMVP